MPPRTTYIPERPWHIKHWMESIDRLIAASSGWSKADAARGEKTIKQLEKQLAEARGEAP
ncbi:hypothetical protein NJC38_02570 [Pseudomonas sp. 21LCFQ010]|uniref:hypothetical protein n=1 Tax=Pseudomonas sp. 21LCFQ010 TaxID=2957506 RepID=UPI002096D206|nr:hypothetical protein [Pseudomonas sp. 21LCFQ010]MCO8161034.1 hypothetical protein [Pseudomonas sp. 21LCFQ010]